MAEKDIDKADTSSGHSDNMHNEKKESISTSDGGHLQRKDVFDIEGDNSRQLNAVFENPLAGIPPDQLMQDVEDFCHTYGLTDKVDVIKRGALVARDAAHATEVEGLTQEEKEALVNEKTHKWRHPWMLYWLCCMCSLSAATQGMDETANNGAVPIYSKIFGLEERPYIQGLVVSSPYLACCVLGCCYGRTS